MPGKQVVASPGVRYRVTRLDREYEACMAAIEDTLAEPPPGDTKHVHIAFLEPQEFIEKVIMPIAQSCYTSMLPPPSVLMFKYRKDLLYTLQSRGLPLTCLGPNIVESLITATTACLKNNLDKKELMDRHAIREREREYAKATWNCVINVVKAMYDLASEYGYAEAMGELEVS
jgi:hypothetical protein